MSAALRDPSRTLAPVTDATTGAGARVGMIGAGQLARMTHQAAIDLGIDLRVLAASVEDSAVRAGANHVLGAADDLEALRRLSDGCDVVTFDHELVPEEHVRTLQDEGVQFAPGPSAARLAQDKIHARRALQAQGFPVPAHAAATTAEQVAEFGAAHGWPLVAKAPRGGYDGRGVWVIDGVAHVQPLLAASDELLLEPHLVMDMEIAVLAARSEHGTVAVYPPVETIQQDGMCREVIAPAALSPALAGAARALAEAIAIRNGVVGLLALELFVVNGELLVNEVALRPHNCGHVTIEGSSTSQFEQHLRAVLGWPLGSTDARAGCFVMVNVVGPDDGSDPRSRLPGALAVPQTNIHLYGKAARPGRKLGHVTACASDRATALHRARQAAAILEGRFP